MIAPGEILKYDTIGFALAATGSILSVIGALVNNLWLDHTLAMWFWMFSNPILLVWAYGIMDFDISIRTKVIYSKYQWWGDGITIVWVAAMYAVFAVSNFYGLFIDQFLLGVHWWITMILNFVLQMNK